MGSPPQVSSATLERVMQVGIIPAIRTSNVKEAMHAAEAIRAGGIPIIEVSLALPEALDVVEALANALTNEVLVGAGTVVDVEGVRRAAAAGAQFIVTPGFSLDCVRAAKDIGIAIFAGALTPTEVQVSCSSGADAVKLFPCYSVGGPRYLQSLYSQYPGTRFIASGGISLANCADYVRAGACAIGVGGDIADSKSMAAGDHRVFTLRAKRFCDAIAGARQSWK